MQSLRLMGIPVTGDAWAEHLKVPRELNPKGFYDLPFDETFNGIHDDRYRGMAVKLFGRQLSMTPPELVRKLIVCTRGHEQAIESTLRMLQVQWLFPGVPATRQMAKEVYKGNYADIMQYPHRCSMHPIAFEDMVSQETCEQTMAALAEYVDAPDGIGGAVDNVDWRA